MTKETDEWGNIELPGLTDNELYNKNWNKVAINKERFSDPEFKKKHRQSIITARQRPEVKKNTLEAQKKFRTSEYNIKHSTAMELLYKSKEWQESVKKSTQNPERNLKISKAHSRALHTPEGDFYGLNIAAKHFQLTSEGIRHRIKTQPDKWYYLDIGPSLARKDKISTSFGNFFKITHAYRYAYENDLANAKKYKDHVKWFLRKCEDDPTNFFKIEDQDK